MSAQTTAANREDSSPGRRERLTKHRYRPTTGATRRMDAHQVIHQRLQLVASSRSGVGGHAILSRRAAELGDRIIDPCRPSGTSTSGDRSPLLQREDRMAARHFVVAWTILSMFIVECVVFALALAPRSGPRILLLQATPLCGCALLWFARALSGLPRLRTRLYGTLVDSGTPRRWRTRPMLRCPSVISIGRARLGALCRVHSRGATWAGATVSRHTAVDVLPPYSTAPHRPARVRKLALGDGSQPPRVGRGTVGRDVPLVWHT